MDKIELLLKELTEASGISGYESEVRAIIRRHFALYGEISQDKLGSLICRAQGSANEPRILVVGHMDEIGFMVKLITPDGFIRFVPLGGWPNQNMLAHRVAIETSKGKVLGVIGSKPPYLADAEERKKVPDKKDMFIDIGATSAAEVEAAGVRLGDPIIPVSQFSVLSPEKKTYMAKAFDDRIGNAITIAVLESLGKNHPNTLFAVATTQEGVGVRGATTCTDSINPDVAIIVDVSPTGDLPGLKPEDSTNKIGAGPALVNFDPHMVPNLKLRDLFIETARESDIPLQQATMEFGGYDGGPIHTYKGVVTTVVLGLPTRHVHSHNAILRREDFDNAVKLTTAVINKLDKQTVEGLAPV
jgi:putative aminopeptidase FrvX